MVWVLSIGPDQLFKWLESAGSRHRQKVAFQNKIRPIIDEIKSTGVTTLTEIAQCLTRRGIPIDLYLKDRAGKRFTVIQAVAAHYTGLERPNPYGATVFIKSASAKSPGGVKYEANPAYFKNVDYAVDEANAMGMYVAIVAIWGKSYVNEKHSIFDTTGAFNYGQFLGSRYRGKRVIFILGGDWYPEGTMDIWAAMADGMRKGDEASHLITFHPTGIQSSSRWYQDDAWLSFNMVQSRHIVLNRSYEIIAQDWARTPVKPVVDGESAYEGIVDDLVTISPGFP